MPFEYLLNRAQFGGTSGGYLTGDKDPYRQLRQQAQQTVQAAQLNPYQTPAYQYSAPKIEQGIKAGAASAGIADSLLTNEQVQEAKSSLAAQIYQNLFSNRLGALNTAAGIPYLRDASSSYGGGFGGFGGGGGGVNYDFGESGQAADLQRRAFNLQSRAAAGAYGSPTPQASYIPNYQQGGGGGVAPVQTTIVNPDNTSETYYGTSAPLTPGSDKWY